MEEETLNNRLRNKCGPLQTLTDAISEYDKEIDPIKKEKYWKIILSCNDKCKKLINWLVE